MNCVGIRIGAEMGEYPWARPCWAPEKVFQIFLNIFILFFPTTLSFLITRLVDMTVYE